MLKIIGAVLVIFACAALGDKKSAAISDRLFLLREIEKLLLLLMGEITYRREALPEAVLRVSGKVQEPLCSFLKETAEMAQKYQGERFACIFRENAEKYLKNSELTQKDFEEFVQLGEYLGWMDITLQKNTITLYQEQLKQEIQYLERELPGRKKMCQSLGVIAGIFLSILCL